MVVPGTALPPPPPLAEAQVYVPEPFVDNTCPAVPYDPM